VFVLHPHPRSALNYVQRIREAPLAIAILIASFEVSLEFSSVVDSQHSHHVSGCPALDNVDFRILAPFRSKQPFANTLTKLAGVIK
jgi:hypothetical protein